MITANLSPYLSRAGRTVYAQALDSMVLALGIKDYEATLNVLQIVMHRTNMGSITNGEQSKEYDLFINAGLEPHVAIHTLGHEMIHFHQHLRGDLKTTKTRIYWKGKRYPVLDPNVDVAAYQGQPWEQEAFEKHDWLFEKATQHIDRDARREYSIEFEITQGLMANIGDVDVVLALTAVVSAIMKGD